VEFLKTRGAWTNAQAQYTDKQISDLFLKVKASNLLQLEKDIANIS